MRLSTAVFILLLAAPVHSLQAGPKAEPAAAPAGEVSATSATHKPGFEAQVRGFAAQVKDEWPVGHAESREFYTLFKALRLKLAKDNPVIFENARWPLMLQFQVERELALRRVRRAAKGPQEAKPYALGQGPSALRGASLDNEVELNAGADLDSVYVRKDGKRVRVRSVKDPPGTGR